VTLGLYLVATALTAFSPDFLWFAFFRALTGAGIGGEYAAINSAIQELIPARHRGHTDLVVNGSFWIGAALGAVASVLLLDPHLLPEDLGWRCAFGLGAALGTIILWLRRWVPESPRRLVLHDRIAEAERILGGIECRAGAAPILEPLPYLHLRARKLRLADVARRLVARLPAPHGGDAGADGDAGVLLQRDLLHLRGRKLSAGIARAGDRAVLRVRHRAGAWPDRACSAC